MESFGFAAQVRAVCAPAYDKSGVGRPGIDPVVYLKMIMVGFFEDLPSERAIAARCADSMSIRAFLKYELMEDARSFQLHDNSPAAGAGGLPADIHPDAASLARARTFARQEPGD